MHFSNIKEEILYQIDVELQSMINSNKNIFHPLLREMINYHMGWEPNETKTKVIKGKRIRPLLLLLTTGISGENWRPAIPAALAIEFLHNFTLVHDDIQDISFERHGRTTIWKKYGIPQAINLGDAMYSISTSCLDKLKENYQTRIIQKIITYLHETTLHIIQGQVQDLVFEETEIVSTKEYLEMIDCKTASLISAATKIGAILSNARKSDQENAALLGKNIGMAFQIRDDYLGIWGNEKTIGKSTTNDLIHHKQTLPIIKSIEVNEAFFKAWKNHQISKDNVHFYAELMKQAGVQDYIIATIKAYTDKAIFHLSKMTKVQTSYVAIIEELIKSLKFRNS